MQSLSILVIHNRYQQAGGEDAVVGAEVELLRRAGHRVVQYVRDNSAIASFTPLRKASLFVSATWDRAAYARIRALIRKERPDIAHCHNLLPQVSPAAYYACKSSGIPVVQTLHNYRLFCPAGTCFHQSAVCGKCSRSLAYSLGRGCYRDSPLQTAAVALMLSAHRWRGTWNQAIDAYLAPSRFCREYFVAAGLPSAKVHLKPNFLVRDPGERTARGDYALFAGRLSAEKGVLEMLDVWRRLSHIPLVIAGDGPLYDQARCLIERSASRHIKLLGGLDPQQTLAQMKGARFLVFPSRWNEPFGLGLIEAAACGVPAIASRIGAIPELVIDNQTGLLFDPQNFNELVDKAQWAWAHASEMEVMGGAARQLYQRDFTAEKNYEALIEIYRRVACN
ncbi:MAG: glycosyltransferase [Candidatus Korobacteraceae bacterium]